MQIVARRLFIAWGTLTFLCCLNALPVAEDPIVHLAEDGPYSALPHTERKNMK